MNMKTFTDKLERELKRRLPDDYIVKVHEIPKNNGIVMHGLVIRSEEQSVAPTIYLEPLLEEYTNGMPLSKVLEEVIDIYRHSEAQDGSLMEFFLDFEQVKDRVLYKLVHYEKNKELLQDCPYIRFLDLAVVFYCMVISDRIQNGTVTVRNAHMEMWNTTAEELYEHASRNTPRLLGSTIENMQQLIIRLMHESGDTSLAAQMEEMLEDQGPSPMYVLTNHVKMNGAACILNLKMMQEFADEQQKDFYILPSSIHEVILIPTEELKDIDMLHEMVEEVNAKEVSEEEFLSEGIYLFSRLSGTISQLA